MTPHADSERYKNHRFPAEIISHGVWLYYRFTLSYRDVEELLLERGITVSHEGFCQVVEAEMLIRQAGASRRSYPPFRRPAPCLSPRPNSRSGSSSLGGTPARTADAVEGE